MSTAFELPLRVYIEDTDAGGIVYYVNYLKFMERARTEFMRTVGVHKAALMEDATQFVVSEANVRYLRPAALDDPLRVTAQVVHCGAAVLTFRQQVLRGDECLCEGEIKVVRVDGQSMMPRRLPKALRARLQNSA